MKRKYRISKVYHIVKVGDDSLLMPVFEDLTDSDLRAQFDFYIERDDFEYLEQIVGEATLRGIRFKVRNKKS